MPVEHDLMEGLLSDGTRGIPFPLGLLNDHLKLTGQLTCVDGGVPQRIGLDLQGLCQA
jgi:hypothetical protein